MSLKKLFALAALAMMALPAIASAQVAGTEDAAVAAAGGTVVFPNDGLALLGLGIGLGIVIFGAAKGIGAIGSHAVDSIARQPEAGGRIFTSMIITAALIEGATLFAVVVILLSVFRL